MPLEPGKSREAISHNIATEIAHGHPQKQAVAIAMRTAGVSRNDEAENPENLPGMDAINGPAGILSLADELVEEPHLDPPAKPEIPQERVGFFESLDDMPGQEYKAVEVAPAGMTIADIQAANRKLWAQQDPLNPENQKQNENA